LGFQLLVALSYRLHLGFDVFVRLVELRAIAGVE
jgi:hypothetical protein